MSKAYNIQEAGAWGVSMMRFSRRQNGLNYQTRAYTKVKACFAVCVLLMLFIYNVEISASSEVEIAGDVLQYVLPSAAAAMTLGYKDRQGALQFGASTVTTLAATYGLKYAINEKRPNGGKHSFPSRHTSLSFTSAEYMRKRYGWKYGVPAYALASFVAYSRVESRNHHAHDVIAGAAIGILSSYFFTQPYKEWVMQVESSGNYYGLRFSRMW